MDVIVLKDEDLTWPMGMQESTPAYLCPVGSYGRSAKVDPYPCYRHNHILVQDLVDQCHSAFPLTHTEAHLYILGHEVVDRCNGLTYEDTVWYQKDGKDYKVEQECLCGCGNKLNLYGQGHAIVLSGKRIPMMPAMTRYLVTHEYGHAVFNYVARLYGYKDDHDKLNKIYSEIRGIPMMKEYRGRGWHIAPGEVVANDFRILFTQQETEFWPHDVCPPPVWDSPIGEWWKKAHKVCTEWANTKE